MEPRSSVISWGHFLVPPHFTFMTSSQCTRGQGIRQSGGSELGKEERNEARRRGRAVSHTVCLEKMKMLNYRPFMRNLRISCLSLQSMTVWPSCASSWRSGFPSEPFAWEKFLPPVFRASCPLFHWAWSVGPWLPFSSGLSVSPLSFLRGGSAQGIYLRVVFILS